MNCWTPANNFSLDILRLDSKDASQEALRSTGQIKLQDTNAKFYSYGVKTKRSNKLLKPDVFWALLRIRRSVFVPLLAWRVSRCGAVQCLRLRRNFRPRRANAWRVCRTRFFSSIRQNEHRVHEVAVAVPQQLQWTKPPSHTSRHPATGSEEERDRAPQIRSPRVPSSWTWWRRRSCRGGRYS
jgi:hypothetical protein